MNLDFLSSRKGDIPDRNSEMKPHIKDTLSRIKQGNFSKKEQAALAAVLILAASGTGYGAFLRAPLAQQEALKAALKATPSVAHAQEGPSGAYADEKATLKETEVEQAIANDIGSDPNVEITSEEVVPDGENSGLMNLVVDHYGSTDTLSQYLETLQGVSYKLNIDSISYNRDPSDVESSSIRLSIPYEVVDNSLASKTFDVQAPEATPPAAPDTTATPGTGSSAPSTSSGSSYYSSGSSSSSWTPSYPSTSTTPVTPSKPATPAAKPPATKPQAQAPAKSQVKPQSETPPRMPERVYLAPAVSTYSVLDSVLSASTVDGLSVICEPQTNTDTDRKVEKKDQVLAVKFETPQREQGAEALKRVINLDTGGFYLPKNGYEFSIDVPTTTKTAGNFSLILADLQGNSKEVLASRKVDLNDGYSRLFFPLNGMDGTIRANQIRYTFMDTGAMKESINLKNVQVLSHEK